MGVGQYYYYFSLICQFLYKMAQKNMSVGHGPSVPVGNI